jgi:hypothetical protein
MAYFKVLHCTRRLATLAYRNIGNVILMKILNITYCVLCFRLSEYPIPGHDRGWSMRKYDPAHKCYEHFGFVS